MTKRPKWRRCPMRERMPPPADASANDLYLGTYEEPPGARRCSRRAGHPGGHTARDGTTGLSWWSPTGAVIPGAFIGRAA